MITEKMSEEACDMHVRFFVEQLEQRLKAKGNLFEPNIAETLADIYRQGWNDADETFRRWGTMQ